MVGLLCAAGVDDMRPRGPCGTHPGEIAAVLFFASLAACGVGVIVALRHASRRHAARSITAGVITVYACALSLYMCLPYMPWLEFR